MEGTMKRLILLLCVMAIQMAHAQQFRLTVASSIAGNAGQFKGSLFVFRTEGCADPAVLRVTASGEGLVNGVRRTVVIEPVPLAQRGAYAVGNQWLTPGTWVVNLTANCKEMTAGAIVPIGPQGFTRETTRSFSRPATPTEVSDTLKALAANGGAR
jgi:hypothetical protein